LDKSFAENIVEKNMKKFCKKILNQKPDKILWKKQKKTRGSHDRAPLPGMGARRGPAPPIPTGNSS
jgi:hypothetical protein